MVRSSVFPCSDSQPSGTAIVARSFRSGDALALGTAMGPSSARSDSVSRTSAVVLTDIYAVRNNQFFAQYLKVGILSVRSAPGGVRLAAGGLEMLETCAKEQPGNMAPAAPDLAVSKGIRQPGRLKLCTMGNVHWPCSSIVALHTPDQHPLGVNRQQTTSPGRRWLRTRPGAKWDVIGFQQHVGCPRHVFGRRYCSYPRAGSERRQRGNIMLESTHVNAGETWPA